MKKTVQYLLYAVFIVLTFSMAVMLMKAWRNLNEMKMKVTAFQEELQEKSIECLSLKQEIYDLKNNPQAIEKVARERYKLVKDGEIIYTFPEKKQRPANSAVSQKQK